MEKKNYISPCMVQVEWAFEALCLTASGTEEAEVNSGISPEPWIEGNTNWW